MAAALQLLFWAAVLVALYIRQIHKQTYKETL